MTSLGTLELGTHTDESGDTALNGSDPVLENIAGTDDADDVFDGTNDTHAGQAWFTLADMPGNFDTMNTVDIRLRYGLLNAADADLKWDSLQAQIRESNGSTVLTDTVTVASNITDESPTNSSVISMTSPNTTANKTVWDAARVYLTWNVTRAKGGDAQEFQVYAAEITGDYDIAASGQLHSNQGNLDGLGVGGPFYRNPIG